MRVALVIAGLSAWLAGGLGLRAWLGGRAYLQALLGSEALAQQAMSKAIEHSDAAAVLGMDPWTLLLAFAVSVAGALVLLVLWPCDLLLSRLRVGARGRVLAGGIAAAVACAATLLSIHPLLARPSVPEGPRTVLNYACEAAGYGWVNAIAYLGALGAGLGFAWLGVRAQGRRASAAAQTNEATASSEAEGAASSPEAAASEDEASPLEPEL